MVETPRRLVVIAKEVQATSESNRACSTEQIAENMQDRSKCRNADKLNNRRKDRLVQFPSSGLLKDWLLPDQFGTFAGIGGLVLLERGFLGLHVLKAAYLTAEATLEGLG